MSILLKRVAQIFISWFMSLSLFDVGFYSLTCSCKVATRFDQVNLEISVFIFTSLNRIVNHLLELIGF